ERDRARLAGGCPSGDERRSVLAVLERRNERVIERSRAPQNPAVVAGVVDRLLLRLNLFRSVFQRAKSERLDPRTHVLRLRDSELLVADTRRVERGLDYTVWLGVGTIDPERSVRVVRRIYHRKQHVGGKGEFLPVLSDFQRTVHRRHQTEYVSGIA